jgi:hypothetical protein
MFDLGAPFLASFARSGDGAPNTIADCETFRSHLGETHVRGQMLMWGQPPSAVPRAKLEGFSSAAGAAEPYRSRVNLMLTVDPGPRYFETAAVGFDAA